MAPTFSKETRAAIEVALQAKARPDLHAIADVFDTTYQSVWRISKRLREFEATGIDSRKQPGPKPRLGDEEAAAQRMRELLQRRPELHQSDIAAMLERENGVKIGIATVNRLLKKYEIPHKRYNRLEQRSRKGGPPMSRAEVDRELRAAREQRKMREEELQRAEMERMQQAIREAEATMLASQLVGYNSPYS